VTHWEFDLDAITAAARELGLQAPVVAHRAVLDGPRGEYWWTPGAGGYHNLCVRHTLEPDEASEVLWHELGHAWQRERDGQTAQTGRLGGGEEYRSHPLEVEARTFERRAADHPLVRLLPQQAHVPDGIPLHARASG
jgi:hypothetical protein